MTAAGRDAGALRRRALVAQLDERVLVLDGAMGTGLQAEDLGPDDFGGPERDGCNEVLVLTRPDVVLRIHRRYLEAGCDVVETNTFGATPLVLDEFGLGSQAREINREAARLARQACEDAERASGRMRWVAGSMGPTTRSLSVTGGITFDALRENFREQALGLVEGGVDYLLLETCQDTLGVKAGLLGIDDACAELGVDVPVAVSGTIEPTGTMLAGQDVDALAVSLMHRDLLYLGLNCATGPEFMSDPIRSLSALWPGRTACLPNAGLPDADGIYAEDPESVARVVGRFVSEGWLNVVGGCCGTTPDHVRALVSTVAGRPPRIPAPRSGTWLSGIEALEVDEEVRPVIVGERTNVLGSRRFKRLVAEGRFEQAAEVGRAQVKGGAHVLDVCLQDPDADEAANLEALLAHLVRQVKVPLVIDTTDAAVMDRALRWCQGKSLLNSVNLENGVERFDEVVPLARTYGAALVVGLIDEDPEDGMAVSVERKLEIARRSHRLLTETYGVREEDIVWDPLTFPCGTGDEKYVGSARMTVDGVAALKSAFPRTKTILGISNVSFGLPPGGREVLNSVFLHHCVQAGLDMAIVNSERLERYPSIPDAERRLCEDLIDARGEDPVAAFTAHFRERAPRVRAAERDLSLAERLEAYIIEGTKEGLVADLDRALADPTWPEPLDIVNGPLMAGMAEVGRLFNRNDLIVAEVLQSASAMKAAVTHLEPHMPQNDGARVGTILLATVKGDVHDIGKNLVEIVLANNGWKVVDLGIKVPAERIVEAAQRHRPDAIGLSGLLVKSARMMVATAEDLRAADIDVPLLVGGAALSPAFTYGRIAAAYGGPVAYAKDAMVGLAIANRFQDETARPALVEELVTERERAAQALAERSTVATADAAAVPVPVRVRREVSLPSTPPRDRVVLSDVDLDAVWEWLNPQMLYAKHLGLRGHVGRLAAEGDPKFQMLERAVDAVKAVARADGMRVRGVYRFFPVRAVGDSIVILDDASGAERARWDFPRQGRGERLCLADYVLPAEDGTPDHLGLFVVSAGAGIRERVAHLREQGHYLESHALGALAVETAEAAAEWLHADLRRIWGFPDADGLSLEDAFRCRYRGCRYSFGYPACPDLEAQRTLFDLLQPEEVGVHLTDGLMMDPEASVSALVFHHPDARYFAVRTEDSVEAL